MNDHHALAQDLDAGLSKALSNTPHARRNAACATAAITNRAHNVEVFRKVYVEELLRAVIADPKTYGFAVDNVPTVAGKMALAFKSGSYNHDGKAIKATCKHFGIKHTHAAMEQFFNNWVQLPLPAMAAGVAA